MLNDRVQKALNDQMNFETYSGYIYLAMALWAEERNFPGIANWLRIQAGEEILVHAMKFQQFILDRGGHVELDKIDKPKVTWETFTAVFEEAYAHERKVTERINKLYDLAVAEDDKATQKFLDWFITEQVEEEKNTDELVKQFQMIKEHAHGLFMLDKKLAGRQFAKD